MEALSLDLRRRIVARYARGNITYAELADLFDVGEASVSRLLRRARENGSLERDAPGGGFPPRIAEEQLPALIRLVAEKPDRTLAELCEVWVQRHGGELSTASLCRALRRAGVTRKKSPSARRSKTARTSARSAASSLPRSPK